MDYKVLEYDSKFELEKKVKELIQSGWQPQGGLCMVAESASTAYRAYVQAMVKPDPKKS